MHDFGTIEHARPIGRAEVERRPADLAFELPRDGEGGFHPISQHHLTARAGQSECHAAPDEAAAAQNEVVAGPAAHATGAGRRVMVRRSSDERSLPCCD